MARILMHTGRALRAWHVGTGIDCAKMAACEVTSWNKGQAHGPGTRASY